MKKNARIIVLFLVAALALSACKVQTPVPPTAVPSATAEDTSATPQGTVETVSGTPTATPDTRLSDDEGLMICTPMQPFFPELTQEEKDQLAIFPEVTSADWTLGPEDATLTIMAYDDFQCPACASFYQELETLMAKYPDDVRFIFRHFPLESIHPNAKLAAQASEAAGLQDKFWDMYHALYSKQSEWSALTTEEFTAWLTTEAETLGLDVAQFTSDLTSEAIVQKIQNEITYDQSIGLNSTPTLLVNGRPWQYDWSASTLGMVIEVLKAEKDLDMVCPPFVIDTEKTYTATITTEHGDMVFELYPKEAPLAVNSFVYLAREGFYDGITFHRVMHDFVAQAGDPSGTGISGGGYEYREEIATTLTFDEPYMLGVARANQPNTSGSQFFITYVAYPTLNGQYTIFGKLIEGVDVLNQITERDTSTNPDAPAGDKIISITITED